MDKKEWGLFLLRLVMAWTFLWAFFDKLIGLGFSTCRDKATGVVTYMCSNAMLSGGSPTAGFLKFAAGSMGPIFQKLSGVGIVDWLFMIGLFGIGITMLFGAGMNLGSYGGATLMILMYLAAFKPFAPGTNPLTDAHIIEALVLLTLNWTGAGNAVWGLGNWWNSFSFVKKNAWLQ